VEGGGPEPLNWDSNLAEKRATEEGEVNTSSNFKKAIRSKKSIGSKYCQGAFELP